MLGYVRISVVTAASIGLSSVHHQRCFEQIDGVPASNGRSALTGTAIQEIRNGEQFCGYRTAHPGARLFNGSAP